MMHHNEIRKKFPIVMSHYRILISQSILSQRRKVVASAGYIRGPRIPLGTEWQLIRDKLRWFRRKHYFNTVLKLLKGYCVIKMFSLLVSQLRPILDNRWSIRFALSRKSAGKSSVFLVQIQYIITFKSITIQWLPKN